MTSVAIIVPVYCTTDESVTWLMECLASAYGQGELVVVDDGSPLQKEVFEAIEYSRVNTFVRLDRNTGVCHARNVAVSHASADLLLPLDCDDRLKANTVERMLANWDGEIPVYTDVMKFGMENIEHFTLLDFMCEHIVNHVGFSAVNVLHSKDQWRQLGGWNEALEFYEDGEYNARLFSRWCAKRIPEPLIEYRIHAMQRTKQYKEKSASIARQVLSMTRRLTMGCKTCGGTRTNFSAAQAVVTAPPATDINTLPGEVGGRVLAQYIGNKGAGKHYYNGFITKFSYKVTYGDYVYVDPQDAREVADTSSQKMLVRIHKPAEVDQASETVMTAKQTTGASQELAIPVNKKIARIEPRRMPVEYPDIYNMSVKQATAIEGLDPGIIEYLLIAERRGKNRTKVIKFLEAQTKGVA